MKNKKILFLLGIVLVTLLTACTTPKYVVTFDTDGGNNIESVEVEKNGLISKPTDPKKEGYTFEGWFKEETKVTPFLFTEEKITSDVTIYAKWSLAEYTVSFKVDGGSSVANVSTKHNSLISKPTDPTKAGYTFEGWFTDENKTLAFNFITTRVTSNVTLYAKWANENYVVSFDSDGGSLVDDVDVLYQHLVTKPDDPTRVGYTFLGWYVGTETTPWNFEEDKVEGNMSLVAKWGKEYRVYFDSNVSAHQIEHIVRLEGEEIGELPTLETFFDDEKAYKFLHWSKDGEPYAPGVMPAKDVLLKAEWEESLYISFDVGLSSDSIKPILYNAGASIKAPTTVPTREGYLFKNWFYQNKPYIFNKMPDRSIKLEANYQEVTTELQSISTLPKMYIDLDNNLSLGEVNREDYNDSSITIISDNPEHQMISVPSEFRGRGHGSWTDSGDKRGYRLKFFSKQSMFGEPKSKHWVLLAGANFDDPTLFKAASAFNMARDVFTHIEYTTSSNWVELYVNGQYRGVYMVMEHVRVDKDRVDIPTEYGVLDTGYLIELDGYAHEEGPEGLYYFKVPNIKYPFVVKGPDPDDFLDEGITETQFRNQVKFIQNYTTEVFTAALNKDLNAFMEKADINSFIDMYLLHELYKNTDTGWSSFYMYKKPGGKLYAGPAWDFDATAGASRGDSSIEGFYVSDRVLDLSKHTANELFISLMQIPEFRAMAKTRLIELEPTIKAFINAYISEEFIETHTFAFGRNFAFWGRNGYNYPTTIPQAETRWVNDTNTLKNWLLNRLDWLVNNF